MTTPTGNDVLVILGQMSELTLSPSTMPVATIDDNRPGETLCNVTGIEKVAKLLHQLVHGRARLSQEEVDAIHLHFSVLEDQMCALASTSFLKLVSDVIYALSTWDPHLAATLTQSRRIIGVLAQLCTAFDVYDTYTSQFLAILATIMRDDTSRATFLGVFKDMPETKVQRVGKGIFLNLYQLREQHAANTVPLSTALKHLSSIVDVVCDIAMDEQLTTETFTMLQIPDLLVATFRNLELVYHLGEDHQSWQDTVVLLHKVFSVPQTGRLGSSQVVHTIASLLNGQALKMLFEVVVKGRGQLQHLRKTSLSIISWIASHCIYHPVHKIVHQRVRDFTRGLLRSIQLDKQGRKYWNQLTNVIHLAGQKVTRAARGRLRRRGCDNMTHTQRPAGHALARSKKCANCNAFMYCSYDCQRDDWRIHYQECHPWDQFWEGSDTVHLAFSLKVKIGILAFFESYVNSQLSLGLLPISGVEGPDVLMLEAASLPWRMYYAPFNLSIIPHSNRRDGARVRGFVEAWASEQRIVDLLHITFRHGHRQANVLVYARWHIDACRIIGGVFYVP
ncbi:hypothetical protein DFP72DRAFT_856864 [Ephemerocybe angulata]|uniref:MYND-type domain-containing protein n=1 Tax=Ephemerocybe angulata TaxID=980116 RepID=A0A8H6LWS6_9AGAR|nr:hypothetical protein DFP72DRAFT_856864 [Tulosesus angulatus]